MIILKLLHTQSDMCSLITGKIEKKGLAAIEPLQLRHSTLSESLALNSNKEEFETYEKL